ncbi:nitrate/nitrite two-component system sensor histidine kinase NarQ [Vibrio sp. C8]
MVRRVERSLIGTIAKAMFSIVMMSFATISFAIITLASSLNDAEAVNVSGSMRMQSYRLAHDIQSSSIDYVGHIESFEHSLFSPSMQALKHWTVPEDIQSDYNDIIIRWQELKTVLKSDQRAEYLSLVAGFVSQIDVFVFKLQQFSESKLIKLAWVGGLGLGGVFLVSVLVVIYTRREVVGPLRNLVVASEQVQNRSFDVQLKTSSRNEMAILTRTFNDMANELGKLYHGLENAVNEKTHKLQHANQSLQVLYESSQQLTASRISQENFQTLLKQIISVEGIEAVRLEIDEEAGKGIVLNEGYCDSNCNNNCHEQPLMVDGQTLGRLYWRAGLPCPDRALIDSFVQMLSRAVYFNKAQKQAEQLLLMEERATIARELHDSLAQSLSYLKIQVSLLKRVMNKLEQTPQSEKTEDIIKDIDEGLSGAYTQLRELLTTFRLTIKEGNFGRALLEMINQLKEHTSASIELSNNLSSLELNAHQQVHLMQLIREAVINAIKHADATKILVECNEVDGDVVVEVEDNGVGFEEHDAKLNHYGLSIMQERAARLNGELTVNSSLNSGCKITLKFKQSKDINVDED